MADELAIAMRDAGAELAETFSSRGYSGPRTRYGTVTANNGTTLDVALAGGTVPGVPMTTACVGARAGDRVLLTVDGPLVTATGILATADNGPYVLRGHVSIGAMAQSSYSYVHVSVSFPSAEYVVAVTSSAAGLYWTWASFAVDDKRPDRFTLRYANNSGGTIPDFGMDWVAVWRP